MFISNLSIKRPVLSIVVVIALLAVGAVSYFGLAIEQYPETDTPVAAISITQPGASAESIETEITKKVEDTVGQISGVKHVSSTVSEGVSQTVVQFNNEKSTDEAAQEVKDKISSIRGFLPQDINEPVIQKFDFSSQPILSLVVTGPLSGRNMSQFVEDEIVKKLNTVKGVGSVTTYGEQDREIHIKLDKEKMTALNLTTSEILSSLQSDNIKASSGNLTNGDKDVSIQTDSKIKEVSDFLDVLVASHNGVEIRIKDIAQVEDGVKARSSIAYYNGSEAISIDIVKQSGQNTTQVAKDVKKEISQIQASLKNGVQIYIVDDNSLTIQDSVNEVQKTILEGCALAVIIVFLFLRNWGSTLISAVSLPTSIITTFAAMKVMGISLNTMSLMGLSLAVGLLVDDSIVVIENIMRHLNMGKSAIQAAKEGTAEIGLAVMATTFTIVAVFLPISLVTGMIGPYFKQFGMTVASSVLVSLFVSFTLVPMLSSKYLKRESEELKAPKGILQRFLLWFNHQFDKLSRVYSGILTVALRHRVKTMTIVFILFFASLGLFSAIGTTFVETTDNAKITIEAVPDSGTTLESAAKTAKQMESILKTYPEVKNLYTTITAGKINIVANVPERNKRTESLSSIGNRMRTRLQEVSGVSIALTTGLNQLSGKDIQLHFTGNDFNQLLNFSQNAEKIIKQIPGTVDVSMNYKAGKPEVKLEVDRDRAADLGVSPTVVASTLSTLFNGSVATHFETGQDRYDVKVLLQDEQRQDFDSLKGIYVPGTNGRAVPLDQVTKQVLTTSPTTIQRYDKAREIQLSANLVGIATTDFNKIFADKLANELKMPVGVSQTTAGSEEMMAESIVSLGTAFSMGILFIFLILAAQFESFMDPMAIIFSLPFAIIGAVLALFLSGSQFSMMAFIGVIMLMGLVTKNAILLIDFAKQKRAQGTERNTALLEAAATRLRPIIMTTLAMIFGMLPTALSTGTGAESRVPMAYTIIGGLISSTFLTLVAVPVIYTLLDDLKGFVKKIFTMEFFRGNRKKLET
ncbi:cation/multidrug efflux pump [Desulfosporosinus orientis DSM 765]|uniref:Cation/multidrug efflux pump n=1 Tax=Desulfosporosinus orientis (strain ATCC 19365 / DSM 765 / NCIMB 8382 / VKM B-1628 / Singapore I) TaxID=768706 RepID=G7W6C0_DESOD|nr:efflux RND transporter permease subunit [Desulfosporosinus orientis]AET68127.1 cation/multidrug efflux pump [Desulfosporosinus orientis DSM 765]